MSIKLHIIYGLVIFVLLVLSIIGYSYCGRYKSRCQNLSDILKVKSSENEQMLKQVVDLEKNLGITTDQLKAKATEAEMLNSALSDLRKRMGSSTDEKRRTLP